MAYMVEMRDAILQWMNQNEKLAGWAQFAGAMLALLIAVWVPWYQARAAAQAARADRIERELASIEGVFFVLTDVVIWLKSHGERGDMPRKVFRDTFELQEILERIRLWEARENDHERVGALFMARGAILRAQQWLALPFLEGKPMTVEELGFLRKGIERTRLDIELVQRQRSRAHRDKHMNQTIWFNKPVALLSWTVTSRWLDRRDRATATSK